MNDAAFYADLLADHPRVEGFRRAIETVVRPGDRVADLGTGLGTYAFFAARAGAGRVWGVESGPIIHVARELALLNGLSDTVTFVDGPVPQTPLERPLDVLIFEDFPRVLLDGPTYDLLAYAQSCMGPGARMVPCGARLRVAAVGSDVVPRFALPSDTEGAEGWGVDWSPLRLLLANCPRRADLGTADLIAPSLSSPTFSLHPLPSFSALRVEGRWEIEEDAVVQALVLWFELELSPGLWISNGPGDEPSAWGQTLLPLDPPVEVAPSRPVEAAVWREQLPNGAPGWLSWQLRTGERMSRGHEFAGLLIGPEDVRPKATERRP